jgi:hypothetical protein
MKKIVVAGVAVLALAASTTVYAQHRNWEGWRRSHAALNTEDRLALLDARIAAVKAGLKLTPDQEKNWPAIETAVRDFAKQRIAQGQANEAANQGSPDQAQPQDPVARLRAHADRLAATAAGLKQIADAADPLYKTLDDGQKRRLALLTRMGGGHRFGGMMHEHGFGRDERGPHHDMGREMGREMERDFDHGPRGGRHFERDDGPDRL